MTDVLLYGGSPKSSAMKQFQNILCVVDPLVDCQVALKRAFELAERHQAQLKLVDVVDTTRGWLALMARAHADLLEQERGSRLETLAEEHARPGVHAEIQVLKGRPALAVISEAVRGRFDLVVKDARGMSRGRPLLVGPSDMRLPRKCPCPVWLNMRDKPDRSRRILAAIDPFMMDATQKELNRSKGVSTSLS